MPKNLYLIFLILSVIVLTVLSLKESISLGLNLFSFIDKVFHISAYIVLTYLFTRYLTLTNPSYSLTKILLFVGLVLTIYGIVIEVLQSTFTKNREGELEDVIANISGIILGSFLYRYLSSRILI